MITTGDEIDLPVAVADSIARLSQMLGISEKALHSNFSKAKNPDKYPTHKASLKKYHTIIIEENDE